MFDQEILERPIIFPLNMRSTKLNFEAPYRRVATAINGNPREPASRGDIFAIGDQEYLVPDQSRYEGGNMVESIIRLDQAQRIVKRPQGSRQISDMELSSDVSAFARVVLEKAVEEFNPTTHGYTVTFIRPQL